MPLPDYWLPRPVFQLDTETELACQALLEKVLASDTIDLIDYQLSIPKWQFLCYLADQQHLILHGTGDPNIQLFEPRQSHDRHEFGNRKAVYAAGDGIWPLFYAITDRNTFPMLISNACIRVMSDDHQVSDPFYLFSITHTVLAKQPWRSGYVYLLPAESFEGQGSGDLGGIRVVAPQYASLVAVKPIARLAVEPSDFPFLEQIRPHYDERISEYINAMISASAWPE